MRRKNIFTQAVNKTLWDICSLPFGASRRARLVGRPARPRKTEAQRAEEEAQRSLRAWERAQRGYINAVLAMLRSRDADVELKRQAWTQYVATINNADADSLRSRAVELTREKGLEERALRLGFDPLPETLAAEPQVEAPCSRTPPSEPDAATGAHEHAAGNPSGPSRRASPWWPSSAWGVVLLVLWLAFCAAAPGLGKRAWSLPEAVACAGVWYVPIAFVRWLAIVTHRLVSRHASKQP